MCFHSILWFVGMLLKLVGDCTISFLLWFLGCMFKIVSRCSMCFFSSLLLFLSCMFEVIVEHWILALLLIGIYVALAISDWFSWKKTFLVKRRRESYEQIEETIFRLRRDIITAKERFDHPKIHVCFGKPSMSKHCKEALHLLRQELIYFEENFYEHSGQRTQLQQSDTSWLNTSKLNTSQLNTSKLNTSQLNASKLNASQLNTSQLNASQLNTSQLKTPQLNTSQSDAPEMDNSLSVLEVTQQQRLSKLKKMENDLAATVKESQKDLMRDFQEWSQLTALYSWLFNSNIQSYGCDRDVRFRDARLDSDSNKFWSWQPGELNSPDIAASEIVDGSRISKAVNGRGRISEMVDRRISEMVDRRVSRIREPVDRRDSRISEMVVKRGSGIIETMDSRISETMDRRDSRISETMDSRISKRNNIQALDIRSMVAEKLQKLDKIGSRVSEMYKLQILDISGIVTERLQTLDMVGSKMSEIERLQMLEMTGSELDELLFLNFLGSGICEMEKCWSRQALQILSLDLNGSEMREIEILDIMGTEIEKYWIQLALQLQHPEMEDRQVIRLKNLDIIATEIDKLNILDVLTNELYACQMWLALRLQKLVSTRSEVSTMEIYWTWQIIRLKKLTVLGLSSKCLIEKK